MHAIAVFPILGYLSEPWYVSVAEEARNDEETVYTSAEDA